MQPFCLSWPVSSIQNIYFQQRKKLFRLLFSAVVLGEIDASVLDKIKNIVEFIIKLRIFANDLP